MKKKKPALPPLKHIPANDNPVDPKDIPAADRRNWLDTDRGFGFRSSEPHPYRTSVRYGRDEAGRWNFEVPLPPKRLAVSARTHSWQDAPLFVTGETDSVAAKRTVLARKAIESEADGLRHRYRIAVRAAIGSDEQPDLLECAEPYLATPQERKWASEGLPIEAEFRTGRISEKLRPASADFADVYETANADSVTTSDRRLDAISAAKFLRYRIMHLWRPLVDAVVFGKTMSAIGKEYGGNKEDAAKLGRQKVIDALLIAHECFADLRDLKAREREAEAQGRPMEDAHVSTLGRKSIDLPKRIHVVANDNRRAVRDIA